MCKRKFYKCIGPFKFTLAALIISLLVLTGCLHSAARRGDMSGVRLSLGFGADINSREQFGMANFPFGTIDTPLIIATRNNHIEVVKYLIKRGADVNEKGEAWYTPIFCAAGNGNEEMVKLLLENGAKVEPFGTHNSALNHAVQSGSIPVVKILLDAGADINRNGIDEITPLHEAIQKQNVEMVIFLIENGADVNNLASYDRSPIYTAYMEKNIEIANILLANGADPTIKCNGRKISDDFLKEINQ